MSALHSILRNFEFKNDCFLYKKLNLLLILFITLEAMDFPEISSSRMHPKYVTLFICVILISPLLMSRVSSFFKRLFDPNTIDLVLSSPKWMLNLFYTNQSHNELKFLFKLSSIVLTFLSVKPRQVSSA